MTRQAFIIGNPGMFAAAAPVCGTADPTKAGRIAKIPIWIFHGDQDQLVPVRNSRDMFEALKKAGGNPKYTEYKGVKHNSWDKAYATEEFWEWLFAQKKTDKYTCLLSEKNRRVRQRVYNGRLLLTAAPPPGLLNLFKGLVLILQRNVVSKNPVLELTSDPFSVAELLRRTKARNPKQYRMSKIRIFKTKSAIQQQQTFGILVI